MSRYCSKICAGTRIALLWFSIARRTAARIHHVAYVENLRPLFTSNPSVARINPSAPSCDKSCVDSEYLTRALYECTTLCTSLIFDATSSFFAFVPSWIVWISLSTSMFISSAHSAIIGGLPSFAVARARARSERISSATLNASAISSPRSNNSPSSSDPTNVRIDFAAGPRDGFLRIPDRSCSPFPFLLHSSSSSSSSSFSSSCSVRFFVSPSRVGTCFRACIPSL
mmetsp:Transcript_1428/g.2944  ORF Transcript_1428/g.2944 Transcript_1428/m.2944 type:complete len:227 (-) Transcript_1428:436-1116(-)